MNLRFLSCVFVSMSLLASCGESNSDKTNQNQSERSPVSHPALIKSSGNSEFDLKQQKKDYQLTQFEVLDINESPYDGGPALSVSFSVPLDLNLDIQPHFEVFDAKNSPVAGGWVVNSTRTRAYFQSIEPSQKYRVAVDSSLKSINAQQLPETTVKTVHTSGLQNSVKFINRGKILPSKLTRGLPIESVNIEQVDIDFHRVNREDIPRVIRERLRGYSYYTRDIPDYSELAYSARYQLDYAKNKKRTTIIPIQKIKQLQKPGYYIAVMKPAGEYPYEYQITSFYISNLALHVTSFDNQQNNRMQVHSLSIDNGKTISGVELSLVGEKGHTLAEGKTDQQGNFLFAQYQTDSVVIGRFEDDFAVISLAAPALDLSEQLSITRRQQAEELFLYGPRDLYRPGETISVNGILRDFDGQPLPSVALQAQLLRPDGRVASSFSWHPSAKGFYSRQLNVSKSDPTGEWRLKVTHPGGAIFEYPFSVEEFLPERMKLELSSAADDFVPPNSDIEITAQGDYLYGAPAAGNRIGSRITVKPNHFPLQKFKDFYFGRVTTEEDIKEQSLDDKQLDSTGKTRWLLPNAWQHESFPTRVIFEASLFESGGRPVTRRFKQNIWGGQSLIGVRPLYREKIVKPFSQAEFEIINANNKAILQPIGQLEINLIREDTDYFWRATDGGWDYGQSEKETKVYSRIINQSDSRSTLQLPVDYGRYRLEIKDMQGHLKNSYHFFAGWVWDGNGESGIAGARPDKVRIKYDRESYQAKQTAKITLISPHLGNALIRVESDQILWEKQLELTTLEQTIDIPISADWKQHNLYVTAMVVSPSAQQTANSKSSLIQLPKRALGVQALILDRNSRRLDIKIDAPEVVEPEQKVTVRVSLVEAKKNSSANTQSKTWVTLAAVDTGVLSLSGYKTPDPFGWFYGQRSYQGEIRDSFSQLIKNQSGALGVLRFGGDAELTRGGEQPTTDVQIVSLFSKPVVIDENGHADIELELPNFNGELRLMAVAFSGDKFASQESTMKVRAPLVAEVSMPRFLAKNDQTKIAFDLQNMSGQGQKLTAKMKFSGAISGQKLAQSFDLADGEKATETIPITAVAIGRGMITLELLDQQGASVLTRDWFLDVRPAYPAEFVRQRKVLQQGDAYHLPKAVSDTFEQGSLQAKLVLSSQPPLNTADQLQGLLRYPYGCLEQTSSRAWPLLSYQSFSEPLTLDKESRKVLLEKDKLINAAISHINGMQKSNGSFGLWNNQSNEEHWLTVYAMDFLSDAKNAGYSVPNEVLDKGMKRIKSYVHSTRINYSERSHYSQDSQHYALAFRAYAAYFLSKNQQVSLAELRQINNKMSNNAKSALPLAHLAIAFERAGDNKTAMQLWNKAISFKHFTQRYTGDYGSVLRDTAWLMRLASESKLSIDYQDLIFRINDEMLSKRWYSTQERFALYRLSLALDKNAQADWQAKISTTDGAEKIIAKIKTYSQRLAASQFKQNTNIQMLSGKSLFVDLQMVGYPLQAPKQVSQGISSEKHFYNLKGKPIKFEQVKSGDYVLVRLDLASSKRLPDAMVVDLLPAGFELENPGLEYSQDISEIKIDNTPINEWQYQSQIKHSEYRDDRFVAALNLDRRQSSVIFYLMRAVTPGIYQVPPTQVEDMYRPYLRSLSAPMAPVRVIAR